MSQLGLYNYQARAVMCFQQHIRELRPMGMVKKTRTKKGKEVTLFDQARERGRKRNMAMLPNGIVRNYLEKCM